MKRIIVIGCGGSGKTTVSLQLGELLSIPVHHLDKLFWGPGWVRVEKDAFFKKQEQIISGERWLIDGNYGSTMEARIARADMILFLDLPTPHCLWNVIKRFFQYQGMSRPDMTDGNSERLDLVFIWYILTFRQRRRPVIMRRLAEAPRGTRVAVLKSRKEIETFMEELAPLET